MPTEIRRVGVLIEKRRSASPWLDMSWRVLGADIDPPVDILTEIRTNDQGTTYLTPAEIEFHTGDAGNYRENLLSGAPKLWVVLRPSEGEPGCELTLVSGDPAEGEAMTQNGDLVVEAVAMPEAMRSWLEGFVSAHYVERQFFKRQRE